MATTILVLASNPQDTANVYGNYNENIQGNYHQNSLNYNYREAILERPFIARSPYKGLKKFNAKDKELFFGRERLISKLILAVNQSNLVLVLGASGSGKSSLEVKEPIYMSLVFYWEHPILAKRGK